MSTSASGPAGPTSIPRCCWPMRRLSRRTPTWWPTLTGTAGHEVLAAFGRLAGVRLRCLAHAPASPFGASAGSAGNLPDRDPGRGHPVGDPGRGTGGQPDEGDAEGKLDLEA